MDLMQFALSFLLSQKLNMGGATGEGFDASGAGFNAGDGKCHGP